MYDMKHKAPHEGSDRVMGESNASGHDKHHAHMASKHNHPGDKGYTYGAAGKIGLYLKTKGKGGSAY